MSTLIPKRCATTFQTFLFRIGFSRYQSNLPKGFRSPSLKLLIGILTVGILGCTEPEQKAPVQSTSEAKRSLEAIKRINYRELKAAEASGDAREVADAKVRATQRLAEAGRGIGDARVQETLIEAKENRRERGKKLESAVKNSE